MNILITGGTGLIGQAFIKRFVNEHSFTVLTRHPDKGSPIKNVTYIGTLDGFENLDKFDAVINLQGEPIFGKRWNAYQKQQLIQSRVQVTQQLVSLINKSQNPPSTLLSGSAIGYYGRQTELDIDESFATPYEEFSHQLCQSWEIAALKANTKTRVCLLRTGIVLSPEGGALAQMAPPFKFGLGAVIANGQQVMSWIHIDDMTKAMNFLLTASSIEGEVNFTAPNPASNKIFSDELASAYHRPRVMCMPAFVVNLMFGEVAELLVFGQHVIPKKLLDAGYTFEFPQLSQALKNLIP
ncbi:TIGR01777 family oxidoreductase [Thalassotalea euphylliae]|uniref:TIGR01777 family protein n=1 Tax=Thalassotalea euphylliae TaxID=1655234 RepID=A0A3E0U0P3_9GAMM|nr:TIGR01777 family oxidoreductase [Thalassotalea euphylliae]REL29785.1 TIGR01777 family protein [Thalassotalea euphylliae]